MGSILYAQTTGTQQTQAGAWTPIPGLQLTLPPATAGMSNALVTLNLPNPYATGNDFPGATLGISVDGAVMAPVASFTYESKTPQSSGRMPTTLVVQVKLTAGEQQVKGVWQSVRNSKVIIDSPATLSAVIDYFS